MSEDEKSPDDKQRRLSDKDSADLSKKCTNNPAESFVQVVEKAQATKPVWRLWTHRYPDPDAIGSMMGLAWGLQKAYGIECEMYYDGEISHPQNNAICNLLEPQLKRADEYKSVDNAFNILVDTIPSNAGTGGSKVDFQVVIDHHKELPNGGFSGLCIHMKTGSACTIVFKLLQHICEVRGGKEFWFEDNNDNDSKVATAMIAGIVTDTEFMTSIDSTECDREAFNQLSDFRNPNFLKQIVFFKRPRFWVDVKAAASVEASIDDEGYAIIGLGLIPEKQRDVIADMAEEMVSWASVETAIAFGVVGGERIEGSVRSLNASINVSDFCKKLGGKHGNGGGKLGKGAYRFSLAGMSIDPDEDDETKKKTWELIKEKETRRIQRLVKK